MIYLKLFAAIFFWALTFMFTKFALESAGIITVVMMRCVMGMGTVALFLRNFKWLKSLKLKDWLCFTFLAMVGIVIQQIVQGYGVLYTSTNHAGWLVALSPVFVALAMVLFFKERLAGDKKMGFIICFLGVLLIFLSKQTLTDGSVMHTTKGDLLFVFTSLNWVLYVVPLSIWFKNMPSLRITFCVLLCASVITLLLGVGAGAYKNLLTLDSKTWLYMAYLGVCCSGLALIFYNEGIEKIGANRASAFIYAQPLVTMVASYFVMGEVISKFAFIGGALILCGLYLINVRRRRIKKFYITLIRYFRV